MKNKYLLVVVEKIDYDQLNLLMLSITALKNVITVEQYPDPELLNSKGEKE